MRSARKTSIDRAGRLVVPKEIREGAGLKPGEPLEVRLKEGRVEIEAVSREVRLVRKGGILVAIPVEPVEPLTQEMVNQTRDSIRNERFRD